MMVLLRAALTILLAASYLTLGIVAPGLATTLEVWVPYALLAALLASLNLRVRNEG